MFEKLKCRWFGHDPETTKSLEPCDLSEPNTPTRKATMRVEVTTCKRCGRTLDFQSKGIVGIQLDVQETARRREGIREVNDKLAGRT